MMSAALSVLIGELKARASAPARISGRTTSSVSSIDGPYLRESPAACWAHDRGQIDGPRDIRPVIAIPADTSATWLRPQVEEKTG